MKNDCLDAIKEELDAKDIPYRVDMTSKHVHIHYGKSYEHMHVVAKTASDWRAARNERALIRRDLRKLGYMPADPEPVIDAVPRIIVKDETPRCTSLDLAANFSKAHKDVLRAIDGAREGCGTEFDQRNFTPIEYLDAKGRKYRAFEMTRDGFALVAMGFTGKEATRWKIAYISAFNQMERELSRLVGSDAITEMRAELDAALDLMASLEPAKISHHPQRPARRQYIPERMMIRKAARKEARMSA
jgi:Rha family phage regulatory protein